MKTRSTMMAIITAMLLLTLTACARDRADPLNGTKWILTSYNGTPPLAGTTVTITFEDGRVTGSSGCNSYGGSYKLDGTKIRISALVSTLMACTGPAGVMDQESLFLNALSSAQAFQLNSGQLQITTSDGKTLNFSQ